eukprot:346142_1
MPNFQAYESAVNEIEQQSHQNLEKIGVYIMYVIGFIICVIITFIGMRLRSLYNKQPQYHYLPKNNRKKRKIIPIHTNHIQPNDIQSTRYVEDSETGVYYSMLDGMDLDTILEDEPLKEINFI